MNNAMERLSEVTAAGIPPIKPQPPVSYHAYMQQKCDWYNSQSGTMPYFHCEKCLDRGRIARLNEDDEQVLAECECMVKRRSIEELASSGLKEQALRCTFESYETHSEWQAHAKKKAEQYLEYSSGKWLYMAGQSGCGKTHLCTAVCTSLINSGRTVRYVMWRKLLHELQGLQFKEQEYRSRMQEYQEVDVLYIDDFLKMLDDRSKGTELNFAFEIINARYISGKTTIISSELLMSDLAALDAAIAGRINEKASGFVVQIRKDAGRNFRMKGDKTNER